MKNTIKIILLALSAVLLAACTAWPEQASMPVPEVAKPEAPVTAANAASAIMAADRAISDAKKHGNLWRDTIKILDKADNAMSADEYKESRDLANLALAQAESAVFQFYQGEALFMIKSLRKDYMDKMYLDQKKRLDVAAKAYDQGNVREAYDASTEIMAELRGPAKVAEPMNEAINAAMDTTEVVPEPVAEIKPESKPEPAPTSKMDSYTVKRNDTLWSIAAMPEVYGNEDMWPLLWKANKAKIKRPDDIATGMKLAVNRGASKESVAAAIKHSKLRGATSLGPVDAFDQQYLSR